MATAWVSPHRAISAVLLAETAYSVCRLRTVMRHPISCRPETVFVETELRIFSVPVQQISSDTRLCDTEIESRLAYKLS